MGLPQDMHGTHNRNPGPWQAEESGDRGGCWETHGALYQDTGLAGLCYHSHLLLYCPCVHTHRRGHTEPPLDLQFKAVVTHSCVCNFPRGKGVSFLVSPLVTGFASGWANGRGQINTVGHLPIYLTVIFSFRDVQSSGCEPRST